MIVIFLLPKIRTYKAFWLKGNRLPFYIDTPLDHLRTIATPSPYQTGTLPQAAWVWYGDGPCLVLVMCGDGMGKVERS